MEIFIRIKYFFRLLGYFPYDHDPAENLQKTIRIAIVFSTQLLFTLIHFWFFLYEAKLFSEYTESFYNFITGLFCMLIQTSFVWQHKRIQNVMSEIEFIIEKR